MPVRAKLRNPPTTPQWLIDNRIRSGKPPYPHLDMSQPCKNGQPFVAADGSCLRCGADQGVHGYACDPDLEAMVPAATVAGSTSLLDAMKRNAE